MIKEIATSMDQFNDDIELMIPLSNQFAPYSSTIVPSYNITSNTISSTNSRISNTTNTQTLKSNPQGGIGIGKFMEKVSGTLTKKGLSKTSIAIDEKTMMALTIPPDTNEADFRSHESTTSKGKKPSSIIVS